MVAETLILFFALSFICNYFLTMFSFSNCFDVLSLSLFQGFIFMLFILMSLFNAKFCSQHFISLSKIVIIDINKFIHFYK